MKIIEKISSALDKAKGKVSVACVGIAGSLQLMQVNALAAGGSTAGAQNIVTGIIEVIVDIFPLIGIFFVVAGVFKLIMSYRNNQPEDTTAAAKDIVIGAVFIIFRVFAWAPISALL